MTRKQRERPTASAPSRPKPGGGEGHPSAGSPAGWLASPASSAPARAHECRTHHPRERSLRHSDLWLLQGPSQPKPDFPRPPSPASRQGSGVPVQEFVHNVLDRPLSSPLLWARSSRAAPRGDPWKPPSEQPGPAPGALDAGALAAQAWLLQPPPPPPSPPAGGCQGVRHGSRLACCLIYARQGRSVDSRGAEGKPGAGVGGAGWSCHPRRR